MKWVKFWIKMGIREYVEDYNVYSESASDEQIKSFCEDWVDKQMYQQSYDHYEYDFEIVEVPPKKWLLNSVKRNVSKIKIIEMNNKFYQEETEKHYRLNDKIEKIKDKIK